MIEIQDHTYFTQIVLNSPVTKNALSLVDLADLRDAFLKVGQNQECRFVILKGQGDIFCSGANLKDMQAAKDKSFEQNLQEAEVLYQTFQSMWDVPQPILTCVQGAAMGGGLGLVALSDWVVCDEQARFVFSEVKLGLAPAVISDFILRKFSLSQVASEMILASPISAHRAYHMGLVHEVVSGSELVRSLDQKKDQVLSLGPKAMIQSKRLLRNLGLKYSDSDRHDLVTHLIADLRVSPEGQEGLAAFLQKRRPNWIKDT